jgi:hypothetical protein
MKRVLADGVGGSHGAQVAKLFNFQPFHLWWTINWGCRLIIYMAGWLSSLQHSCGVS